MDFSLEMTVYLRQINKQATSARVVDHCNPDSISSFNELKTVYWTKEKESTSMENQSVNQYQYKDIILQKIVQEFSSHFTKQPFEHNDLLTEKEHNKLTSMEKRLAMKEYENAKKKLGAHSLKWISEEKWQQQGITSEVVHLSEGIAFFKYFTDGVSNYFLF